MQTDCQHQVARQQVLAAEYRYNGLGFRVGWHYDVDADGTVENTADDPWFYFAYDEGWRMVATYRSTDSSPKEQFVHHMAGMGGLGGSSYIDAVILRERDANTAWGSAADGTLEERRYYVQNWRADVVAIVSSAGKLVERARYSAYGRPTAFPTGDTDCDGDWDATDSTDIGSNHTPGSSYAVLRDADLDGDVDAADVTHANSITGGYQTLGRDKLTSAAVGNRIGYAGYQYDPTFNGLDRHLSHVRHRVYDAEAGRWTRRDPLGYVDMPALLNRTASSPRMGVQVLGPLVDHGAEGSQDTDCADVVVYSEALGPGFCTCATPWAPTGMTRPATCGECKAKWNAPPLLNPFIVGCHFACDVRCEESCTGTETVWIPTGFKKICGVPIPTGWTSITFACTKSRWNVCVPLQPPTIIPGGVIKDGAGNFWCQATCGGKVITKVIK